MLDSRMVTSPGGDGSETRGLPLKAFTMMGPPSDIYIGHCPTGSCPGRGSPPGARMISLGVDCLGLLLRRQLGRQIDRARQIRTALDRVRLAGHGILEDRPFEDFLRRRLA